MPRPIETIQAEESTAPRSPLRRSCRIIAVSSSGSSEVPQVKGRRLSTGSENKDDENDQTLKGKRASSITKESVEPKVEPEKTRTRRSSITKENSIKEDEKKLAVNITKSQIEGTISETDKPSRSRRSSVTKEDEIQKPSKITRNSIQNETDEPEKKPGRRRSIQEEKEESTPAKKVKGRRSSTQEDKEEELPQRNTRSRRSASRDLFDETEETKTTKNLRSADKSESNKEPDTKRITRSRRSSTDAPEEESANKQVKTPIKAKRRPSITELVVNLEPIDEKEQESESPVKIDNKKFETPTEKKKQDHSNKNLELSIICETSFVEESENVSIKEDGTSKENTEKLNNSVHVQLEKIVKSSRESTPTKHSPRTDPEGGRNTPENLPLRKSPRIQEKLEKCKSGEHTSHKKCSCDESESSLSSKKIDFKETGNKEKSPKNQVPIPEKLLKSDLKSLNNKDNSQINDHLNDDDDNVFMSNSIDSEKTNKLKTHLSDGSDGSFTIHLSQTKFETTESETDLNDSKTSDSSDKENSNRNLELNVKPSATPGKLVLKECTTIIEQEIPQNVTINRVSNVFRPRDIDYSFVEPMDVDTTLNLNISKMDKSRINPKRSSRGVNETFDETFSLNLSATYIEYPEEQVTSDRKVERNSEVELEKDKLLNENPKLESIEENNTPKIENLKSSSSTDEAEESEHVTEENEVKTSVDVKKQPAVLEQLPTRLEYESEDDRFSETEDIFKEENKKQEEHLGELSEISSEIEQEHESEIVKKADKPYKNSVKISEGDNKFSEDDDKFSETENTPEKKNKNSDKETTLEEQKPVIENLLNTSPDKHPSSDKNVEQEGRFSETNNTPKTKHEKDSELVDNTEAVPEEHICAENVVDISTDKQSSCNKITEEDDRFSESKTEDDRFSETKDISEDYEFDIPSDGEKELADDPPTTHNEDVAIRKKEEGPTENKITTVDQKNGVDNDQNQGDTEPNKESVEENEEIDVGDIETNKESVKENEEIDVGDTETLKKSIEEDEEIDVGDIETNKESVQENEEIDVVNTFKESVEEDEEIDVETCNTPVDNNANLPIVEIKNVSDVTKTSDTQDNANDSLKETMDQTYINENTPTDEITTTVTKDNKSEEHQQIDEMESSFQDVVSDDYEPINENKVEEPNATATGTKETSIATQRDSESHENSVNTTDKKKRKKKNKLVIEESETDQGGIKDCTGKLDEIAEQDIESIVKSSEVQTSDSKVQKTSKSVADEKKLKTKNKKVNSATKNDKEDTENTEKLTETEGNIKKAKRRSKNKSNSEDTESLEQDGIIPKHSEIPDKLRKKQTLDEVLGRESEVRSSNKKIKKMESMPSNSVAENQEIESKKPAKTLENIINSKSPTLKPNKSLKRVDEEDTKKEQFSLQKWFETSEDSKQENTEPQKEEETLPIKNKKKRNTKYLDEKVLDSKEKDNISTEVGGSFETEVDDRNSKKKKMLTSKPSLEEFANAKLDEFLKQKMAEFDEALEEEEESEDVSEESEDVSEESDGDENSFLDDMAEEGEEDTPSEDSNAVKDEGEFINTDSERSEEEEESFENDSFICDEEHYELLSGDEYDLGDKKKKKRSRILNIENRDEDIIKIERKPKPEPKKRRSRIIKVEDSSDSELEMTGPNADKKDVSIKNNNENKDEQVETDLDTPVKKKSSITIIENINVKEIKDAALSERINQLVDTFCTTIPNKGDLSMNLSLEYGGNMESSEDKKKRRKGSKGRKRKHTGEEIPTKKQRLSVSLTEESSSKIEKSSKRRLSQSLSDINNEKKKRKIKKDKKLKLKNKIKNKSLSSTDSSDYIEDLKHETFGLMNQLVTDVKNRPRRVIKPSTRNIVDLNSSWNIEINVEAKPSTSIVSKKEMEYFKKQKLHPKDFRNQMLYESSRVKRIDTKKLLRKKGAYY